MRSCKLFGAAVAGAVALTSGDALASFVDGSNGITDVTVEIIGFETGTPAGGQAFPFLPGSPGLPPVGHDTVALRLIVTGGSVDAMTVSFDGLNSTGTGYMLGGDSDVTHVGSTGAFPPQPGLFQSHTYKFDTQSDGVLNPGETTDIFFISAANLLLDGSEVLRFDVTTFIGGGQDFDFTFALAPSPGALAVLGMAGLVGFRGRRRRP